MGNHFSMMSKNRWPFGRDGALHVANGVTVTIPGGTIKDYTSVTVDAGGILEITGSAWGYIGCAGNFVLNGTLRAIANTSTPATFSGNEIDPYGYATGASISYTIPNTPGGDGGKAGDSTGPVAGGGRGWDGGTSVNGVGGGGGSGADSNLTGNVNGNAGECPNGGPSVYAGGYSGPGAGFAGGSRGANGGGIWLYIKGVFSGNGTINISGSNGGNGTPMSDNTLNDCATTCVAQGGGGGGGAGGSGGKSIIKYASSTFTGTYSESGGAAGSAGTYAGFATSCGSFSTFVGTVGSNGTAGSAGSHSESTI